MRNGAGRRRQIEGGSNINGWLHRLSEATFKASSQISLTLRMQADAPSQVGQFKRVDGHSRICKPTVFMSFFLIEQVTSAQQIADQIGSTRSRRCLWPFLQRTHHFGQYVSIFLQKKKVFTAMLWSAKSNDSIKNSKGTSDFRTSLFHPWTSGPLPPAMRMRS